MATLRSQCWSKSRIRSACRSTSFWRRRERKSANGKWLQSKGRGLTIRPLVPEPVPEEMLTVMDFAPRGAMRGTPHLPGTREFFTCLGGRVTIFVAGERFELAAGDVLAFPGNVPHSYQNPDAATGAHGVSVVILAKAGV